MQYTLHFLVKTVKVLFFSTRTVGGIYDFIFLSCVCSKNLFLVYNNPNSRLQTEFKDIVMYIHVHNNSGFFSSYICLSVMLMTLINYMSSNFPLRFDI